MAHDHASGGSITSRPRRSTRFRASPSTPALSDLDISSILPQRERTRARSYQAVLAALPAPSLGNHSTESLESLPTSFSQRKRCRVTTRSQARKRRSSSVSKRTHKEKTGARRRKTPDGAEGLWNRRFAHVQWLAPGLLDVWPIILDYAARTDSGVRDCNVLASWTTVCKDFSVLVKRLLWHEVHLRKGMKLAPFMKQVMKGDPGIAPSLAHGHYIEPLSGRIYGHEKMSEECPVENCLVKRLRVCEETWITDSMLEELIMAFPGLEHLEIAKFSHIQTRSYRKYPAGLIQALSHRVFDRPERVCHLKSLVWDIVALSNTIFHGLETPTGELGETNIDYQETEIKVGPHNCGGQLLYNLKLLEQLNKQTKLFSKVKSLTLRNSFDIPGHDIGREVTQSSFTHKLRDQITSYILSLPELRGLHLDHCLDINLDNLPPVNSLTIKNTAISPYFQAFLMDKGYFLRTLRVIDCEGYLIDALANLETYCPNLEHFTFRFVLDDMDIPNPNILLSPVLRLPSTLRSFELLRTHHCTVDHIENFLRNLVAQVPGLQSLQVLRLEFNIDVSWRERAELRKNWSNMLTRAFKKRWNPPRPYRSLSQYIKLFHRPNTQKHAKTINGESESKLTTIFGGDDNIDDLLREALGSSSSEGPESPLRRPTRQSSRVREQKCKVVHYEEGNSTELSEVSSSELSDEEDNDNDDDDDEDVDQGDGFMEGMGKCHTVDLVIENSKQAELIFGMEDFLADEGLDSEDSDYMG